MRSRHSRAALLLMSEGIELRDVAAASPRSFERSYISRMLSGERRLHPDVLEGIRRVGGDALARDVIRAVEEAVDA